MRFLPPVLLLCLVGCGGGGEAPPATLREPERLAYLSGPQGIALGADGFVYVANHEDGELVRVPRAGGEPEVLIERSKVVGVALDAEYAYVTREFGSPFGVALDGSRTRELASRGNRDIVVRDGTAYTSDFDVSGSIYAAPVDGGEAAVVASGQERVKGLAVDATHVYYTTNRGDQSDGEVMAAPRTGGPPVLLATQGSGHGTVVLADDAHVYWGQFYGRVARVPKAGGAIEEVANLVRTFALAQDDEYLYAADYDPEGAVHVVRIPKAGGPPQALARTSRSADIRGIAVDDEHVYWTDASARALWRAPKR